jgi:hypothetical protein
MYTLQIEHMKSLVQIKHIIEVLSSPAHIQIKYIGDMSVDELGLEFDDAYLMLSLSNFKQLNKKERTILNELNIVLDKMSEISKLWNKEALNSSFEWEAVRKLAKSFKK